MNIQWYPGHMTKTETTITENLKLVDIVIELVDAEYHLAAKSRYRRIIPKQTENTGNEQKRFGNPNTTSRWISWFAQKVMVSLL